MEITILASISSCDVIHVIDKILTRRIIYCFPQQSKLLQTHGIRDGSWCIASLVEWPSLVIDFQLCVKAYWTYPEKPIAPTDILQ